MENRYEIFVDSAAGLTEQQAKEFDVNIISYELLLNGKTIACYEEGRDNDAVAKQVFTALREGKEVRTSLINSEKMIEVLTPALQQEKNVIVITISQKLSGTYNQALWAAETLREQFPHLSIAVIDSMNASSGEGMLALRAAHLRDMGESFLSCVNWLEQNKTKINAYCTVDDLKYLRKGGRISATAAIAGTLLNIKPVLYGDSVGKFAIFSKERGRKKALSALADAFRANVVHPESQIVAISHCDCLQDAEYLADLIRRYGAQDVVINYYDVCTGAHIGPGTIALFFVGKDRKQAEEHHAKSPLAKPAIKHI